MKKTKMKKVLSGLLSGMLLFSCLNVEVQTTQAEGNTNTWESKISAELLEKLGEIKEENDEKVKVYIWYNDIDQEAVDEEVEEKTGLTREMLDEGLNVTDEEITGFVGTDSSEIQQDSTFQSNMQAYMEKTKEKREEIKENTDTYIETRRAVAKRYYQKTIKKIKKIINISEDSYLFKSEYAPMVIVQMTAEEIEKTAKRAEIEQIALFRDESLFPEGNYTWSIVDLLERGGIDLIKTRTGLTGKSIKVGILEVQNNEDDEYPHEQAVYDITKAVAPEGEVSLTVNEGNVLEHFQEIENFIDQGVQVINCSFGESRSDGDYYNTTDQWYDHVVYQHNVTIVTSAGNGGEKGRFTPPAMGYNVITVGGIDDKHTVDFSDDELFSKTAGDYGDGCFKPDLVASACFTEGGTSFSAPQVTGTVALMLELNPSLAASPQAIKAILMAACHRKVKDTFPEKENSQLGSSALLEYQGAGALDVFKTLSIVKQKQYGIRTLTNSSDTILFDQPPYSATSMNISIAWLRKSKISWSSSHPLDQNGASGTANILQYTYHGGDNQQWILQTINNKLSFRSRYNYTMGYLKAGSYADDSWKWATLASALDFDVQMQANDDGSYTFLNYDADSGMDWALTPYNDSKQAGSKVAWVYNRTLENQKWYLEKINYRKGDVNLDGQLNSTDLTWLNQHKSATLTSIKHYLADMNDDGKVDAADAALLNQSLNAMANNLIK